MPELPEAETIVRGLRPHLIGRVVDDLHILHADVLGSPADQLCGRVRGLCFEAVERRGKNVVLRLEGPDHDGPVVVVNLGMTGRLFPLRPGEVPPDFSTHPVVRFQLRGGGALVFDDMRRFGTVTCFEPQEWLARSREMGPEPLDRRFTATDMYSSTSRSRSPIRSWLLDQRRIAGVGNIYANEALHRAGIHPRRPARSLARLEVARLHRSIRGVLREAIRAGGTTIRDYRGADGIRGRFVRKLAVYGRESEPCPTCGAEVLRIVFGNRSAFLCPSCQPSDP